MRANLKRRAADGKASLPERGRVEERGRKKGPRGGGGGGGGGGGFNAKLAAALVAAGVEASSKIGGKK